MKLSAHYIPTSDEVVERAAYGAVVAIQKAWNSRRDAQVVITGGRTGLAFVLALDPKLAEAQKSNPDRKVHIWFSDERFVSFDNSDRTDTALIAGFKQASEFIIFHRALAPSSIQDSATTLSASLEESRTALQLDLDSTLQEEFAGKKSPLNFDIVILSMGEDGHIASCFPGDTKVLTAKESAASIANSPKPPAERTTITLHRLGQSEITFIFALGEGKREALEATLAGSEVMPIELLRQNSPSGEIVILTDLAVVEAI